MNPLEMRYSIYTKRFFFLVSVLSMFFGGIIYLLWRPTTLLMFSWCRSLGIYGIVLQMRSSLEFVKEYLPSWFIYSLPQALWCFSGLCSIHAIWMKKNRNQEYFWIAIILMMPFLTEFMQFYHLIPGTYDVVDLVLIVMFFLLFNLIIRLLENWTICNHQ